jgi:hypothetical protein
MRPENRTGFLEGGAGETVDGEGVFVDELYLAIALFPIVIRLCAFEFSRAQCDGVLG